MPRDGSACVATVASSFQSNHWSSDRVGGESLTSVSVNSGDARVLRCCPNGSMSEEASKNRWLVWCSRVWLGSRPRLCFRADLRVCFLERIIVLASVSGVFDYASNEKTTTTTGTSFTSTYVNGVSVVYFCERCVSCLSPPRRNCVNESYMQASLNTVSHQAIKRIRWDIRTTLRCVSRKRNPIAVKDSWRSISERRRIYIEWNANGIFITLDFIQEFINFCSS